MVKRLKKAFSFYLNENLMDRLDKWRLDQPLQPSRTHIVETAIDEYLRKHDKR